MQIKKELKTKKDGKTIKQIFVGDIFKNARKVSNFLGDFTKLASYKIKNIQYVSNILLENITNEDSTHDSNNNKMRFLGINVIKKIA